MTLRLLFALGAFLTLAGCGGPDPQQVRLCERLIGALDDRPVEAVLPEPDADRPKGVIVRYRTHDGGRHWIACAFAGGAADVDRLALVSVATDREGTLSPVRLHMLRRWLGMFSVRAEDAGGGRSEGPPAHFYALQQIVNAVAPCCIYGLLAIGYTLVDGIVGTVNLAFGEMAMIGGYVAFLALTALILLGLLPLGAALLLVLAAAVAVGAAHGWSTERAVFRPLAGRPTRAPLIASVGLVVALQEYVRLVQGSRDRWLQPLFAERWPLAGGEGFSVSVGSGQLLVAAITLVLYAALWQALARTAHGRAHRACCDDRGMAALVGVDVRRVVMLTFVVGTAYAAVAGTLATLFYGLAGFYTGQWIGLKALTAAILGGIGSVPGAMLGGIVIGAFETAWAAWLPGAYRDVAVFALLIAVLVFRPQGLLGRPEGRGD